MLEIQCIGNLGQDATIKDFNGRNYIAFNLGHSERYTDKDGVKHERTTWISCLKPINDQSTLAGFLKKGTQVYVRGRVSARAFQRNDGTVDASLNCTVTDLQLLSSQKPASQNQPSTATNQPPATSAPTQQAQTPTTATQQSPAAMQAAVQNLANIGFAPEEDDLPF